MFKKNSAYKRKIAPPLPCVRIQFWGRISESSKFAILQNLFFLSKYGVKPLTKTHQKYGTKDMSVLNITGLW
jgi:hypothetical protein